MRLIRLGFVELEQIKGEEKKSQDVELSPLPYHYRNCWARERQTGCPHLTACEQANGLGGLDPNANITFSVGQQDSVLAINDLKQQVCESHLAGLPNIPAPTNISWLIHVIPVKFIGEDPVICEIEGSRSRNRKTLTLKRFIDGLLAKQSFYLRRGELSDESRAKRSQASSFIQ